MRGHVRTQDVPHYDNPHKQEAARFLAADVDVQPMIDGMDDLDRVDCWLQVVERFEFKNGNNPAADLRERRAQLQGELDQQAAFEPASATDDGQAAITDGGAVAVEDEAEVDDGQDVMEYADDAERESKRRDAASVAKMFDDAETVREKIAEEQDRETIRPHVLHALRDRLNEVEG